MIVAAAEWRIVFDPLFPEREKDEPAIPDDEIGPSPLRFCHSNGKIIPYFMLPFEPNAARRIYLGPKNHARDDHSFLQLFPEQNHYDVDRIKIVNSAATYTGNNNE